MKLPRITSSISHYLFASAIVSLTAGLCYLLTDYIGYRTVSYILLLTVSLLSIFMGIGPIALAALISALAWNFFFIPPRFTINIDRTEDILMLGMFFTIALVNGVLTTRIRRQELLARDREKKTAALYQLTKALSGAADIKTLADVTIRNIKVNFSYDVLILIRNSGTFTTYTSADGSICISDYENEVAETVFNTGKTARIVNNNSPDTEIVFYPIIGTSVNPGVIVISKAVSMNTEDDELWSVFFTQISNAIERGFLGEMASRARFLDESDKLYRTLFNSISHELRIPVATIMSASESLLTNAHPDAIRDELSAVIMKGSKRLNRLIENLLNMSRLESGHLSLRPDWCDIHDLVNKVADDLAEELKPFNLLVEIPEEMPLVRIDFGLIEQVLYNLVFNATQYASNSSNLTIRAYYENGSMIIEVSDRGPGIPPKDIPFIFDKFYRIEGTGAGGTGLGLSIAKGFTEAHCGTIIAGNRPDGGAKFTVKIPSEKPEMVVN